MNQCNYGLGRGMLMRVRCMLAFLAMSTGVFSAHAGAVMPNGTTRTTHSEDSAGRVTITPAPVVHDVSYNAFSRFDVTPPGVVFLNKEAKARTIVAEVFSAAPSRIEGPVTVEGARANLILSNQNGVAVNGGSFVNFGSVALTTGAVHLRDVEISPGFTQRYVDVATKAGAVQIEPGGLSGDLIRFEVIAKTIGLDGPITNAYTSPSALTRLVAGESLAYFDTLASPSDNLTPWVYIEPGKSSAEGIAIDISARSKIRSGRVELHVTDHGAGVRNAGELFSTSGGFVISASGLIEQSGGQIAAAGPVRIAGESFLQTSQDGRQSQLRSATHVRIDANADIRNIGGLIQGEARDIAATDTPFAVMLSAGGELENRSEVGGDAAVIFGSADDVGLFSKAALHNTNARIVSNAGLRLESQGLVVNESLHGEGTGRVEWRREDNLLLGLLQRKKSGYSVDMGTLLDPQRQAYMVAEGDIHLSGQAMGNLGGYVFSNDGGVYIDTVQGVENRAHAIGTYSYRQHCVLFICDRHADSTEQLVGGQINAAGPVVMHAGGDIVTRGGQVYALGDIDLDAQNIVAQGVATHTALLREDGLKAFFGDTWARILATDQGGFVSQNGRMTLRGRALQDHGYFKAGRELEGAVEVIAQPRRDAVAIEDHLGILSW